MIDILWAAIFGVSLVCGIIWSATAAQQLMNAIYAPVCILLGSAGFTIAAIAAGHLYG